jgi:hypothetical protein
MDRLRLDLVSVHNFYSNVVGPTFETLLAHVR